jgi:hypothetical protein
MPVYSIEMKLCATLYVVATTPAEARAKAKTVVGLSPDVLDSGGDVPLSDLTYTDPDLPEISFSPAMTIHEPWDDRVECASLV